MISSPLYAVRARPSSVKLTSSSLCTSGWSSREVSVKGAPPFLDVHEELVAEHADARRDRRRDGRAEHADGRLLRRPCHSGGNVVAEVHEEVQIFLAAVAVLNSVHDALEPARSLAARCALP